MLMQEVLMSHVPILTNTIGSKYLMILRKAKQRAKKVDYWVPEKCGKIAGLYKTDPACQPPEPQEEPKQEPNSQRRTTNG